MFLTTDDKQLVNARYIKTVNIDGMKLNLVGPTGEPLGSITCNCEVELEATIGNLCVSHEARAIDRLKFQLEDMEVVLEDISSQLHNNDSTLL